MSSDKVIVRFPPSPTGPFHIGNARTFLFNYLFAKQNGGQIVFRLEDTDRERSKKEYADDIIENLKWLKIEPDFSTLVRQSERGEVYKKYLQKLVDEDKAYIAEPASATATAGEGRNVIRFKNPNKKIKFNDLIRGEIEFDTTELKDFVIAKSMDEPVYHLAVVVDDFEMGVTHILRGDDGISNTPRQILIQEAIGAPRPTYAHLPLMIDTDKTKLSKRKHGEKVSVTYYKNAGYLPEALVNYLAMVGWNPGTEQEIWSLDELIKVFDITAVQKKSGIFNIEKLNWINRAYLLRMKPEDQILNIKYQISRTKFANSEKLNDFEFIEKLSKILIDRIHRWGEAREILDSGEYDYLFEKPVLDESKICWKNQSQENAKENLEKILKIIESRGTSHEVREEIMELTEKEGKGEVLWPLRYCLSGKEKSPDPFTLLDILGSNECRERIGFAIETLQQSSG